MKSVIPLKTRNDNYYLYFIKEKILTLSNSSLNLDIEKLPFKTKSIEDYLAQKEKFQSNQNLELIKNFFDNGYLDLVDTMELYSDQLDDNRIVKFLSSIKQITFEMTEKCNLSCTYCGYGEFYGSYDKRIGKSLKIDYAINLLTYLTDKWNSENNTSHGRPIYISFYGGEPLLQFDEIKKIISFSRTLNLKHNNFIYSITTNALLLKKCISYLVENDFRVLISLDGNKTNNGYRKYRNGKDAFDDIFENINYVKEKYPDFFIKNVQFNSVLHNLNTVEDTISFIQKQFEKIPAISELNTSGIIESKKKEFWKTYRNYNASMNESENYETLINDLFFETPVGNLVTRFVNNNLYFNKSDYIDLLYCRNDVAQTPTGTCLPMTKKIFVTAQGKILPCERISHEHYLGYVDNNAVNIDINRIKNNYNNHFQRILKLCSKCYNIFECSQCMFFLDLDASPIKCKGFTSYENYKNKLEYIVNYLENNPEKLSAIQNEYEYVF